MIKSNSPKFLSCSKIFSWALAITSIDWYVENTTFIPFLSLIFSNWFTIFSTSVVAGNVKSTTLVILSSLVVFLLEIFESEQIHIGNNLASLSISFVHSLRVCPRRAIDGTKNKIKPFLLVSFSAIFNEVNVLPVPQAIINLPLSFSLKYSCTKSLASFWWLLIILLAFFASLPSLPRYILDQSTSESSSSFKDILITGISWFSINSLAFLDQLFVVEINILLENFFLTPLTSKSFAEVEIKVSTSDLEISLFCL